MKIFKSKKIESEPQVKDSGLSVIKIQKECGTIKMDDTIMKSDYSSCGTITNKDYSSDKAYNEYSVDKFNQLSSYANYLEEQLEKTIKYTDYLAEAIDKNISYTEHIAKNIDQSKKGINFGGNNNTHSLLE